MFINVDLLQITMAENNLESMLVPKSNHLAIAGGFVGACGGYGTLTYYVGGAQQSAVVLGCITLASTVMLLSPAIARLVMKYYSKKSKN